MFRGTREINVGFGEQVLFSHDDAFVVLLGAHVQCRHYLSALNARVDQA